MPTKLQPLGKSAAKMLQRMAEATFLDGECYAFAIALNRGLGWPILGLYQEGNIIRHAVVQRPEEGFFDARGVVFLKELGQPFGLDQPYTTQTVSEETLKKVRPVSERSIARASKLAQAIWPTLPWKNASERYVAFADELEKLSRKHGIWLRAMFPSSPPVLSEADGDEGGYLLKMTDDANSFTIDRYFEVRRAHPAKSTV